MLRIWFYRDPNNDAGGGASGAAPSGGDVGGGQQQQAQAAASDAAASAAAAGATPAQQMDAFVSTLAAKAGWNPEDVAHIPTETLVSHFLNGQRAVQERDAQAQRLAEYEPVVAQYAQNREQFEKWLQLQSQGQAAPHQEPEKPVSKWQPPQWDETWRDGLMMDPETGLYKAKSIMFEPIAQKANEFRRWEQKAGQRIVLDPVGVMRDAGIEDVIQKAVDARLDKIREESRQRNAQQQMVAVSERFMYDNRLDMYEHREVVGPNGEKSMQPVIDPVSGQLIPTVFHQVFADEIKNIPGSIPQSERIELANYRARARMAEMGGGDAGGQQAQAAASSQAAFRNAAGSRRPAVPRAATQVPDAEQTAAKVDYSMRPQIKPLSHFMKN